MKLNGHFDATFNSVYRARDGASRARQPRTKAHDHTDVRMETHSNSSSSISPGILRMAWLLRLQYAEAAESKLILWLKFGKLITFGFNARVPRFGTALWNFWPIEKDGK